MTVWVVTVLRYTFKYFVFICFPRHQQSNHSQLFFWVGENIWAWDSGVDFFFICFSEGDLLFFFAWVFKGLSLSHIPSSIGIRSGCARIAIWSLLLWGIRRNVVDFLRMVEEYFKKKICINFQLETARVSIKLKRNLTNKWIVNRKFLLS